MEEKYLASQLLCIKTVLLVLNNFFQGRLTQGLDLLILKFKPDKTTDSKSWGTISFWFSSTFSTLFGCLAKTTDRGVSCTLFGFHFHHLVLFKTDYTNSLININFFYGNSFYANSFYMNSFDANSFYVNSFYANFTKEEKKYICFISSLSIR